VMEGEGRGKEGRGKGGKRRTLSPHFSFSGHTDVKKLTSRMLSFSVIREMSLPRLVQSAS